MITQHHCLSPSLQSPVKHMLPLHAWVLPSQRVLLCPRTFFLLGNSKNIINSTCLDISESYVCLDFNRFLISKKVYSLLNQLPKQLSWTSIIAQINKHD